VVNFPRIASGTPLNAKYGTLFPTGRLSDGRARTILFDAQKCIGCRQCVQACKDWNDHTRADVFEISADNWITMEPPVEEGAGSIFGRNSCMHCDYPICAAVCPVEAITKYEEGAVVIDQNKCIGCEYCINACPWEVISLDHIKGKASKCTMCADRIGAGADPFCVQACPVQALEFGYADEISEKARARAAETGGYLYGDREAGGTQLLYVLKEDKSKYGLRAVGPEKFPRHRIPLSLMIKDLFTLRLGLPAKGRALYLAIVHPQRLAYRYWPWRKVA
jgi:formate dehydrogenase iron-sulfur subunit